MLSEDVKRLEQGRYLNDNIVNFALRNLQQNEDGSPKPNPSSVIVHVFSSMFFTKLSAEPLKPGCRKTSSEAHQRVCGWIKAKGIDVFSSDFILIPVNESLHWTLAIVCHLRNFESRDTSKRPCIMFLDSLRDQQMIHDPSRVSSFLQAFFAEEWRTSRRNGEFSEGFAANLPCHIPKRVPQQANLVDCGVYTIKFAKDLISDIELKGKGVAAEIWRPPPCGAEDISALRSELKATCDYLERAFSNR